MKKLLAFLLLISHMNTSMLLPQVPEVDLVDASGNHVDDINSVVEYFAVILGYDHTADDEDDDNGQNFHLVKTGDCNFEHSFSSVNQDKLWKTITTNFSNFRSTIIETISFDIITPPPDYNISCSV
jgi:hypothetical protein